MFSRIVFLCKILLAFGAEQFFIVQGAIAGKCTENATFLALTY